MLRSCRQEDRVDLGVEIGVRVRDLELVLAGRRPQSAIPSYVAAFDVCLNPFRGSRAADSVSPLKVYEYLALGRPVVSTPMRALQMEPAADLIALKLIAAEELKRRPSKREHDIADVLALLEEHPELKSPELIARVQGVRTRLLSADLNL